MLVRLSAPFLIAVYPILHLYVTNPGQAIPDMLAAPLFLAVSGTAALCGLYWLTGRDASKASLSAALCVAVFFGFGHLFPFLYQSTVNIVAPPRPTVNPATYELQLQHLLAALAAVGVVVCLYKIHHLRTATAELAALVLAVVAWALVGQVALKAALTRPTAPVATPSPIPGGASVNDAPDVADSPDIYHVVLDGYARRDVLAEYFAFDNGPFLTELDRLGFTVPSSSRANFYWTVLSLSSMLNMRYVTDLEARVGRRAADYSLPIRWIRDHEVARFLKARGYTTVHLNSTWVGTMDNPFADVVIPCAAGWSHNQFYRALAENSVLRLFRSHLTMDMAACHLSQLKALADAAEIRGPKFVFVHFIPPHHPYLFDRNGRIVKHTTISDEPIFNRRLWARRELYLDQLLFMNERMLEAVRAILERSARPSIILLHSDHGPQLVRPDGQLESGWERARFANFVAVHAPGNELDVPQDLELVNLYRLLFNHYFGAKFPMLDGAQYSSPFSRPFAFERSVVQ